MIPTTCSERFPFLPPSVQPYWKMKIFPKQKKDRTEFCSQQNNRSSKEVISKIKIVPNLKRLK